MMQKNFKDFCNNVARFCRRLRVALRGRRDNSIGTGAVGGFRAPAVTAQRT